MYLSSAKIHLDCDSVPLFDPVSAQLATVNGTSPTLVDGAIDDALQLTDNTYFTLPLSGLTTQFTVGFWLKPSYAGQAINSGTIYPLRQALLSKCDHSFGAGTTTLTNVIFCFYEECQSDGTNKLKVQIGSATATSTAYTPGIFHHFWFTYNAGSVKLFIDLTEITLSISGSIPASLPSPIQLFEINNVVPGVAYSAIRNTGVLDDLIIFNQAYTSSTTVAKAANQGALYVADATLSVTEEIDQVVLFDDITTVTVNCVFTNRGNLYVSRSDGELLRGEKLFWEHKRDFNKFAEFVQLTRQSNGSDSSSEISDGALLVQNETIRI